MDQKPNGLMNSKVNLIKRSFGIRKKIKQVSQYLNKNIILKQSREIAKSYINVFMKANILIIMRLRHIHKTFIIQKLTAKEIFATYCIRKYKNYHFPVSKAVIIALYNYVQIFKLNKHIF